MKSGGSCCVSKFYESHEQFRSLIQEVTPEVLCRRFPSQLRYFPFRNVHSPELEAALALHKFATENGGSFPLTKHFYKKLFQDQRIAGNIESTLRREKLPNLCAQFPKILRYTRNREEPDTIRGNADGPLRAAFALRECSMPGQPFDVHSFCTQHPQAAQTVCGAQIGAVVGNAADQEFEDVADDDNVEPGEDEIKAIWTGEEIIEQARFIPDIGSKIILLDNSKMLAVLPPAV